QPARTHRGPRRRRRPRRRAGRRHVHEAGVEIRAAVVPAPVSGDALLLERAQPPRHRRSLQPRRGPWVSINAEMTGDGDACLIVDNPGSPSPVTTSPAGSSRSEDWLRTTGSATTVARHPAAARAIRSTAPATAIEGRQPVVGRGQNSRSMRAEPLALNAPTTRNPL